MPMGSVALSYPREQWGAKQTEHLNLRRKRETERYREKHTERTRTKREEKKESLERGKGRESGRGHPQMPLFFSGSSTAPMLRRLRK